MDLSVDTKHALFKGYKAPEPQNWLVGVYRRIMTLSNSDLQDYMKENGSEQIEINYDTEIQVQEPTWTIAGLFLELFGAASKPKYYQDYHQVGVDSIYKSN